LRFNLFSYLPFDFCDFKVRFYVTKLFVVFLCQTIFINLRIINSLFSLFNLVICIDLVLT